MYQTGPVICLKVNIDTIKLPEKNNGIYLTVTQQVILLTSKKIVLVLQLEIMT